MPESVKKKVELEGVTARNLIKFNVPIKHSGKASLTLSEKQLRRNSDLTNVSSNGLSTEAGNAHNQRSPKQDYRARYWAQMLDTLRRTIDEIYSTCDEDESEMECREIIMILEHSTKDFYSLIEKMQILKNFESQDSKPNFLAWDERKISAGKPIMKQIIEKYLNQVDSGSSSTTTQPPPVNNCHEDISSLSETPSNEIIVKTTESTEELRQNNAKTPTITQSNSSSWADRVKSGPQISTSGGGASTSVRTNIKKSSSSTKVRSVDLTRSSTKSKSLSNIQKSRTIPLKRMSGGGNNSSMSVDTVDDWTQVQRNKTKPKSNLRCSSSSKKSSQEKLSIQATNNTNCQSSSSTTVKSDQAEANKLLQQNKSIEIEKTNDNQNEKDSIGSVISYASIAARRQPSLSLPCQHIANIKEQDTNSSVIKNNDFDSKNNDEIQVENAFDSPESPTTTTTVSTTAATILQSENTKPNSSENEFSAEDEEYQRNILLLDKELQHVEDTENALANELHRVTVEAEDYRQRILLATNADEEEDADESEVGDVSETEAQQEIVKSTKIQSKSQASSSSLENQLDKENKSSEEINSWQEFIASYSRFKGISWDLLEDEDDILQMDKVPPPGHGVQMHEKLSSPSRKKVDSSIEKLRQKQDRAQSLREKVLLERTEKIRELTKKVEEVRSQKENILNAKRDIMDTRLKSAEEKRIAQLEKRVRKAQDEETKGKEIAFIQYHEAAQKHQTILTKHQESAARLAELQEERRRKNEEKAEREAAVEKRRLELQAGHQAKLDKLQEKWKSREVELATKAEDKERSRLAAARAKEQERESKKAAIDQQRKDETEKLKTKIQKKQEDSERRHQEQLREIRRKAFEMSVLQHTNEESGHAPPNEPYAEKKWCRACSVMIESEVFLLSHLRGKRHQMAIREKFNTLSCESKQMEAFNLEHIVDAPSDKPDPKALANSERRKTMKNKQKKLRQKLILKALEFQKNFDKSDLLQQIDSVLRAKYQRIQTDIRKQLNITESGPWGKNRVCSLNKSLGEILRSLDKGGEEHVIVLLRIGAVASLCDIISLVVTVPTAGKHHPLLPDKPIQTCCDIIHLCCQLSKQAACHLLLSNLVSTLVNALHHRLTILVPDDFGTQIRDQDFSSTNNNNNELPIDHVCVSLMKALQSIILALQMDVGQELDNKLANALYSIDVQRAQDMVSYIVSMSILDQLSVYLSHVRGPLNNDSYTLTMVHGALSLLTSLLSLLANFRTRLYLRGGDHLVAVQNGKKKQILTTNAANAANAASAVTLSKCSSSCSSVQSLIWFGDDTTASTSAATTTTTTTTTGSNGSSVLLLNTQDDPTQLLKTVQATELFGLVCLLYGLLLHSPATVSATIDQVDPIQLSENCVRIALVSLRAINNLALLSLPVMQSVLAEEGTSLQLRHILSYLITYVTQQKATLLSDSDSLASQLLNEALLCIGYFVVLHPENQCFIQTGHPPTLIQQLRQLPCSYFMKPRRQVLLPTLIACSFKCPENVDILRQEVSLTHFQDFIQENLEKIQKSEETNEMLTTGLNEEISITGVRFRFENRFPIEKWKEALIYYQEEDN